MKEFDAFISHSSEDKIDLVRPLSKALQEYGAKIWYDEFSLKPGVSLSRSIEKGLSNSKFGLVVLSESFFKKNWTEYELRALNSFEVTNPGIIIPIWYNVDVEAVRNFSPYLSDKLAIVAGEKSIDDICVEILDVIREDLFEEILQKRAWKELVDKAEIKLLSKEDLKQLKIGPIRHAIFSENILTRIRLIRISLIDVYPHSFEYWLNGFQRDMHPENEIAIWEMIATCYLETHFILNLDTKNKKEAVFALVMSSVEGTIKEKFKSNFLDDKEIEVISQICDYSTPFYDIEDKSFEEN